MAKARRAKKSKVPKKLLIVPLLLVGVGAGALKISTNIENLPSIRGSEVETYEVNDFFRDAFTVQDGTKYLPIEYTHPYVDGERITKTDIENELRKSGLTVKSFSTDTIGTGTKVETTNGYTYTVLIYGDVNSDGLVNVLDALDIIEQLLLNEGEGLTGVHRVASNVDNEKTDRIDVNDVLRIVDFIVGNKPIIDTLPKSDVDSDEEAPVIKLKEDVLGKIVTIKVGEDYVDPGLAGLEITDNLDPSIESKLVVDTSRIIKDIPNDYIVTYNVTDASGNKATEVTRVVRVVDYVTDIEYTWPNNEFYDGDEITLDDMTAYAVYKYAGKTKAPVDVKLAGNEPVYAVYNETGKMFVTVEYDGFQKDIEVIVNDNRPIITIEGPETDIIKVFSDKYVNSIYVDQGATVRDKVDTDLVATATITNTETGEEVNEIRTNKPGVYTITYTVTNSKGKEALPKVRNVEVVDYIEDVIFRLDNSKFKTEYVDGDTISKEGVEAYAIWKYASHISGTITPMEITDPLDCDTDIVSYDRRHPSYNINKDIVFSYTVIDKVDGTETTYKSDNIKTQINVIKKLESIVEEATVGTSREGDKYDYIWVARVKAGDNEEKISVDKITCTVTSPDIDKDGFMTRAWVEPAYQKDSKGEYVLNSNNEKILVDGYVDVYFVGIGDDKLYTIDLRPVGNSEYIQTTSINVKSKVNNTINYLEIGELEDIDGNPISRFKSGETVYAKLTFYHRYGKVGEAGLHEVPITNVPAANLSKVYVQNSITDPISTIKGEFLDKDNNTLPSTSPAYVTRIKLTAEQDATKVEKEVSIIVAIDEDTAYPKPITLYPASIYTLDIGSAAVKEEPITLSLRELTTAEYSDYEVRNINGNYYTLLPINLHDQWEDENVYYSDLSTNYTERNNGKIVIYDGIDITGEKSYIDVIGIDKYGNPINDVNNKSALAYIGIAIKDAESSVNEEDILEGKTITIYFENKECKVLKPITIKRQAISSIQYKDATREVSAECYRDTVVNTVISGPRQEAITNKDIIEVEVKKQVKNAQGVKTGVVDVDPSKYEVTTTMETSGEVTIHLSVDDAGTYEVTPKLKATSNTLEPMIVEIIENREVNKVVFIDTTDGINKVEGDKAFGEAAISVKERREIEFYHEYFDDDGNKLGEKEVKNVNHDLIKVAPSENYSSILTVDKMSNNSAIPDGLIGESSLYIDEIRVIVNDVATVNVGDKVKFKLTIYKDNTQKEPTYDEDITVTVEAKPEISYLKVGWIDGETNEDINIYVAGNILPEDKDKVIEYKNAYYTLVPIKFYSAKNQEIAVDTLNLSNISTEIGVLNKEGGILFIDNINKNDYNDLGWENPYIDIKGFTKGSNIPVSDKQTPVDYIGIAVLGDNQLFLSEYNPDDPNDTSWLQLKEINIYWDKVGGSVNMYEPNSEIYTLNIKTPDINNKVAQARMRSLSQEIEPITLDEEDIKYTKNIDPEE